MIQTTPAAAVPTQTWLSLDSIFWATVLVIFLVTIIGAFLRMRQRDKCLRLFDGHHVTYLPTSGQPIWGDLAVVSQGLEILFDAPHHTARGLVKRSTLLFPQELKRCLAICRSVHALTPRERDARETQIRRSFNPGLLRQFRRWLRNILNTLRDAFARALTMIVGRFGQGRSDTLGTAVQQERAQLNQLGTTIVGMVGNAYEPLLERHIGKPVIIELACPGTEKFDFIEVAGYLVDYSEQFVAIFNLEQEPINLIERTLTDSTTGEGYRIDLSEGSIVIQCKGPEILVVRQVSSGGRHLDLAVALTCGARLRVRRDPNAPVHVALERTRFIDLICPREFARVRYGSALSASPPEGWRGIAPDVES